MPATPNLSNLEPPLAPAQPGPIAAAAITPQPLTSNPDTDTEMSNANDPPNPARTSGTHPPSTGFTIRIPGPTSYANALRRAMGQTEDPSPERPNSGDEQGDREEVDNLEPDPRWPLGTTAGPIKGFCADHIMENLNPLVHDAWEKETPEAVFVHYLDEGYCQGHSPTS